MESSPKLPAQLPPQPPRALNALVSGFNAVANNIGVILFPVLFDILFWLGPRLKIDLLLAPILSDVAQMQSTVKDFPVPADFLTEFWGGFNLLSSLRTFPLGIFSLMSVNFSSTSPLGARPDVEVSGALMAMALTLFLTVLGWLGGSLYFYSVSRVALEPGQVPGLLPAIFHSLLVSGIWASVAIVISLPVFLFLGILFLISPSVGVFIYLILTLLFIWMALPIFFSAHGIFTRAQNAITSLGHGFRMVRYGLPPLGWFVMLALVIGQGLDVLWRVPPTDSWMTLVGILGHAFVSTSLLAASFIFYRDLQSWIDAALQWIKTNQITSARA
jgi:hypothetical protein